MKRFLSLVMLAVVLSVLAGCYTQYTNSRVLPHTVISQDKAYFVVRHANDTRKIDLIIADEMKAMGMHKVSSGYENEMPAVTDVVVRYEDRWMWDMTNYLLMLKVQFRDASNDILIARGQSVRTSLVRKPVPDMVQETLVAIFNDNPEEV